MSGFYTEADYENSVIELFENMGYRHVYAPDLDRDFRSPLYEDELEEAIHRLNPNMPEDAIEDALYKLKNFENAELVKKKRTNGSTSFICEKIRRNNNNATLAIHHCRKSNFVEVIIRKFCKEEFVFGFIFSKKGRISYNPFLSIILR